MRYVIQAMGMMTDIIVFAVCGGIIILGVHEPGTLPLGLLCILVTIYKWKRSGGFMAWKRENIRALFRSLG